MWHFKNIISRNVCQLYLLVALRLQTSKCNSKHNGFTEWRLTRKGNVWSSRNFFNILQMFDGRCVTCILNLFKGRNSAVRDYPVVLNIDGACAPAPR